MNFTRKLSNLKGFFNFSFQQMYSVRFALGMNESNFKCTMHHLAVIYGTTETNILLAFSGNKYCNDYQRSLPWLSNDSLLITWNELKMPTFGNNTNNILFPRQLRDSFATWVAAQIYNFFVAIDGLVYWILMLLQFNHSNIGLFQIYIVIAIQKCLTRVCILFFLRKVRVSSSTCSWNIEYSNERYSYEKEFY